MHRVLASLLLCLFTASLHADSGRGRHKKLYAVPTPGAVVIDGKLDDWDFSGHILSFVHEDSRQKMNAKFAIMYDDEALYIGAEIADESPMMNRHSPQADADKAWMGDCVQFRLVSDRTQPYPLLAGNLGQANPNQEAGQPLHLMLWYFTDNEEPALQIHKSMAMDPVREEWAPHGVVPADHFEAAYRKAEDGKSYVMEYRIPWATLNAEETHPVAGDIVTATVQFLWSDATGLNMAANGVTYDIMSSPGFPWQSTQCWGKMIFRKEGDVPRAWVEPFTAPAKPEPLSFTYDLPQDGEVSIALFDDDNRIVKHIVAQGARKKGTVTETWDGQTTQGKPLPVGTYRWKGLVHDPITTRYVMSVANSGQPAWKTADGTGGWGGDYGPPTAAVQAGDRMILGWTGHEAGWGIIATDLNGKKIWGARQKDTAYLATDGERFFAPGEHGSTNMNVYSIRNGQPLAFGNGRQGLEPPAGSDDKTANKPTGVAWHDGTLYVSFGGRDLIGVYDAVSGDLQRTIAISKPGRLAVMADGTLLAIGAQSVHRVVDGKLQPFTQAADHIDAPLGLAVADNEVYVGNAGNLQCVNVFDAAGNYLRTIGKVGGRPLVGAWEKLGMRQPAGIHVDTNGLLWVPEAIDSPKRLSRWNARTGDFVDEFFGANSYSPFMWMDPENPKETFFNNTIWDVDLDKGTWYPKSVFYRRLNGNMVNTGQGGFFYPYRVFTASNGHQYAVSQVHGFGPVLWLREGDQFRPLYFMFKNYPNHVLMNYPPFENMKDKKDEYPPGKFYVWTDNNRDQVAQLEELTEIMVPARQAAPLFNWMDKELNLYGQNAIYRPTSIGEDGVPVYDFQNPEKLDLQPPQGQNWVDPDGTTIWSWGNSRGDIGFAQYNLADQQMAWAYPPLKSWHAAINDGIPQPGELVGPTCPMGVAGRYTGLISYFGTAELVRDDGLFIAQVFEHGAKGNNGPHIFYVEFLAGQLVKPKGSDKYYILAGDQDCRVMEVIGLDTVVDLPGGNYTHTQALADQAASVWAAYEAVVARGQPFSLARGGLQGLAGGDAVGKTVDETRGYQVRAGYDDENLYFRYDVQSPSPLINAVTDPYSIFKGGNLIDIQLAANPKADPARKIPAAGDVRLLISQNPDNEVWAVALRPVVEGFQGERLKLESPTGHEFFDVIERTDRVRLQDLKKIKGGFTVTVVVPKDLVGLPALEPGDTVRMDVGYVFGDKGGTNAAVRAYWHNNSFTANVVNDIPHESRLEPAEWGNVLVE